MRNYCGCGPRAAKFILIAVVMFGVFSAATMLLWNALYTRYIPRVVHHILAGGRAACPLAHSFPWIWRADAWRLVASPLGASI